MNVSLGIHVVGLVLWLGSLILLSRAAAACPTIEATRALRRLSSIYMVAGLLISLGSGIFQLLTRGIGFYMAQPWFHGKLTFVLVLFLASFLLWKELGREQPRKGLLMAIHGLSALILIFLVVLTKVMTGV